MPATLTLVTIASLPLLLYLIPATVLFLDILDMWRFSRRRRLPQLHNLLETIKHNQSYNGWQHATPCIRCLDCELCWSCFKDPGQPRVTIMSDVRTLYAQRDTMIIHGASGPSTKCITWIFGFIGVARKWRSGREVSFLRTPPFELDTYHCAKSIFWRRREQCVSNSAVQPEFLYICWHLKVCQELGRNSNGIHTATMRIIQPNG
jgi:hypothetical protein